MEEEMEKFEITEYDLENEFNINRTRKGLSKHQQIYGIWADDSDDEPEDKYGKGNQQGKNYTAPIGFVAGGVQQAGKKGSQVKENFKEKDNSDDDDDDQKPGTSFQLKNKSDESDYDEIAPRMGFGAQNSKSSSFAHHQTFNSETINDIAGFRTKSSTRFVNQGVGNWEKHTKGIGAKLLLQMGYEPGKGLGKDLQGIQTPVEAHLRKGRGAIGAYGPEKPATLISKEEPHLKLKDSDDGQVPSKWKRGSALSKKGRYYYRSVDDVIEKGKKPGGFSIINSDMAKVKVIDMTGPQQRVLSGYHALSGLRAPTGAEHFEDVVHKKCQNFALPEIQHNLDLLVDMCEQDIIRTDRESRQAEDRITALKQEEIATRTDIKEEENVVKSLTYVVEIVDKLLDPGQNFSLGQIGEIFKELLHNYADEYYHYEISELAPGLVGPLLTSALANWNPLQQPNQYKDFFNEWKSILDEETQLRLHLRGTLEGNKVGIQPYDSLIWHTWVPVMRTCIREWNPHDCDPMINIIESWKSVLPLWILNNILDHVLLPRILKEVNLWNPVTDTIPIHLWIHPWIPLLDDRLQEIIYPLIQDKLGIALSSWHPSDRSAKLMLLPWQRALPPGTFLSFLLKHIVPKLQHCMQTMVINPHQQLLDPWQWVMDWKDMVSIPNITLILDKYFFPKWLQTLAMWLNHNPNYTQVTDWYSGWKRMFAEDLINQPTIKDSFHKALEMMSRAVGMIQQPGAKESISYLNNEFGNSINVNQHQPTKIESISEAVRTATQIPQGFKDLVTKRCEERGILFVPIPNKYHEAKQVYRIGSTGVQCYIDRNVIFYSQNNSIWIPTSLNRLLDLSA